MYLKAKLVPPPKINFDTVGSACNSMIVLIIAGVTAFLNYSEKRRNGFTLYPFATLLHTLLLIFSVVNFKYLTISLAEYSASNFRISVNPVLNKNKTYKIRPFH